MPIQFEAPELQEQKPRIVVFGVGGAGGNAVDNMIRQALEGVEFVVANTDAQALARSLCDMRLQLGPEVTRGLGAGADPEVGAKAAEDSISVVGEVLDGADMCFITAGMGGGTGTGAAPVIAKAARERSVLTVGVVTKPFAFEGARRMRSAEAGIEQLRQVVDTLIVIPNQNLFRVATTETTFNDAFIMADDVLYQGVKGVTDLMVRPGLVNLDFADVRAVMDEMGTAMMGCGEAEGEGRAATAAEAAIDNPLLDEVSLRGAQGVLINITGGKDLTLFEADEAAERIRKEADPEAAVFFGAAFDPTLEGRVRVSVVATGIDMARAEQPKPFPLDGGVAVAEAGQKPVQDIRNEIEREIGREGKPSDEPVAPAAVDGAVAARVQDASVEAPPSSAASTAVVRGETVEAAGETTQADPAPEATPASQAKPVAIPDAPPVVAAMEIAESAEATANLVKKIADKTKEAPVVRPTEDVVLSAAPIQGSQGRDSLSQGATGSLMRDGSVRGDGDASDARLQEQARQASVVQEAVVQETVMQRDDVEAVDDAPVAAQVEQTARDAAAEGRLRPFRRADLFNKVEVPRFLRRHA